MFCPECGKEIADQSSFCGHCGSSIVEKAETNNTLPKPTIQKEHKRGNKIIFLGISIILIIVVSITACFIFFSSKNKISNTNNDVINEENIISDENEPSSNENKNFTDEINIDTEESQESDEADSDNLLVHMGEAEKRDLNIFFSNFSEAFFDYYKPEEALSDHNYFLIGFAFTHNLINNSEKIIWQDEKMGILAVDANKTLERFLGVTVPLESCATTRGYEWVYEDNAFWSPAASGESYDYFSVVTDMKAVGDGTYIVHYNKYYTGYDGLTKDHYTYSIEKANNECEFVYQVTAHVRPKVYNNKNTYEIISLEHE